MDISHQLNKALIPQSIAVIGASDRPDSRGAILWRNLLNGGFQGKLYPVNPKYKFLGDTTCFKQIKDIDGPVDLAILATPAQLAETLIEEIAAKGTRWVMLAPSNVNITSDPSWQAHMVNKARTLGIRLIGTDCLGIMCPDCGLNASYWDSLPSQGSVGFASQSGVIGTSVLSYARISGLGFSSLINTGDEIDLSMDEVIDFFAQDRNTKLIVAHVEGIRNPREFFSSVRAASQQKPVIVLRGGKSLQAGQLLSSRMGVPAGDDAAFDALLERTGAIRVRDLDDLITAIETFSQRRLPRANRIGIIGNGSGFGVLAADAAADCGVQLAGLSRNTTRRLGEIFNNPLLITNPVDLWADADPRRIKLAVDALNQDENVDAILVICAPTFAAPVERVCDAIAYATDSTYKPVFTAWIGDAQTVVATKRLRGHPITVLKSPEMAMRGFAWMSRFAQHRRYIANTVAQSSPELPLDLTVARNLIASVLATGRFELNEHETKRVLACAGLTTSSGLLVQSPVEALDAAKTLGFPVVIKVVADGINHKSNVGGVLLDLRSEKEVYEGAERILEEVARKAPYAGIRGLFVQRYVRLEHGREVSVHVHTDPRFGPVIGFGAGGLTGSIYRDQAIELLPLTEPLARRLVDKPHIAKLLGNYRGMPEINREALVQVLMRVSALVTAIPAIRNLHIDPLLVDEGGCIALDAHIGVAKMALATDASNSHMMLAPAPELCDQWLALKNGFVKLRSIRLQDYDAIKAFLSRLSPRSAYLRFRISSTDLAREKIIELTNVDFNRETAIVAVDMDAPEDIRGVARFKRINGSKVAEFGIIIEDAWQRRGLATLLMTQLAQEAKRMKIKTLVGYVLKGNEAMFALMASLGYSQEAGNENSDDGFVMFKLDIQ